MFDTFQTLFDKTELNSKYTILISRLPEEDIKSMRDFNVNKIHKNLYKVIKTGSSMEHTVTWLDGCVKKFMLNVTENL